MLFLIKAAVKKNKKPTYLIYDEKKEQKLRTSEEHEAAKLLW